MDPDKPAPDSADADSRLRRRVPLISDLTDSATNSDEDPPAAAAEDDEGQLSMSQTERLLHYQQISGLELGQCRRQMELSNWDLMRATDRLFGQQQNFSNSNAFPSSSSHGSASSSRASATEHQPQPPPTLPADGRARLVTAAAVAGGHRNLPPLGWFGWLEGLLMLPFRFFGHSVGSLIRFVLSVLRPAAIAHQRRLVADPVGDVRRFLEEFELRYGAGHPPVRVSSYSQALDAARTELRFLLVYLHAETHQDTEQFCRQVLTSDVLSAFLQASGVNFWMCSVSSPEGARVSQALRETGYPFLALVVLKQGRMTVVARFEGLLSLEQLLAELDAAVTDFEPYLTEERARRQSLEMNRRLVEEQDQAYAEALARDRERERLLQAEEEERSAESAATARREVERQAELTRLRNLLPPEPAQDCPDPTVKLSVRFPGTLAGADRLERRFLVSEPVQHLHYWVRLQDCAPQRFSLCTSYPKRVLPTEGSFAEVGLTQSEVLFVMDNDD